MRGMKRTALLAVAALLLCGRGAAESIGTYIQPDRVDVCSVEDIGYFPAPEGLQPMYTAMSRANRLSSTYLFIMPNGRALLSLACTPVGAVGSAQSLIDQWESVASALGGEAPVFQADRSAASVETRYGFEAMVIRAAMEWPGEQPLSVSAEGVAFYRGGDLMELWEVWPSKPGYTDAPNAPAELEEDLAILRELKASLSFATDDTAPPESP